MTEHKWHYFNEEDETCKHFFGPFFGDPKTEYYTACRMTVGYVIRHTEHKHEVNCLKCLKVLNERQM